MEASFITLTYRDEDLPDDYSVRAVELARFMRELRRQIVLRMKAGLLPEKRDHKGRLTAGLRFYGVGEYGEKEDATKRPHYHLILYGWSPHDLQPAFPAQSGLPQWRSDFLGGVETEEGFPDRSGVWKKGRVRLGAISLSSISYVAGYVFDLKTGDAARAFYAGREHAGTGEIVPKVRSPFSVMSRMPGIGHGWFEAHRADDALAEFVIKPDRESAAGKVARVDESGDLKHRGRAVVSRMAKVAPPRYVTRQRMKEIEHDAEALFAFKNERRARVEAFMRERAADNTPARLLQREAVKLLGASGLARSGGTDVQIKHSVDALCTQAGLLAEAERNGTAVAERRWQVRSDAARLALHRERGADTGVIETKVRRRRRYCRMAVKAVRDARREAAKSSEVVS
jgi:hypothetical protein